MTRTNFLRSTDETLLMHPKVRNQYHKSQQILCVVSKNHINPMIIKQAYYTLNTEEPVLSGIDVLQGSSGSIEYR